MLVAVFVADPHSIQPPDMASALQTAYGLTPAEASLVQLLAHETPSLVEAADWLGVSQTTLKTISGTEAVPAAIEHASL